MSGLPRLRPRQEPLSAEDKAAAFTPMAVLLLFSPPDPRPPAATYESAR